MQLCVPTINAGASGGLLAAETSRAGGLGFIAAGHLNTKESMKELEEQINIFHQKQEQQQQDATKAFPLAIGFIGHSTFGCDLGWELFETVLKKHKPDVVQFFAPAIHFTKETTSSSSSTTSNVQMAQSYGSLVMAQVGTVKDGIDAMNAGVDCIIAQGSEAGGHGIQRGLGNSTISLTSRLVKIRNEKYDGHDTIEEKKQKVSSSDSTQSSTGKPVVLAAGGISDGSAVASALCVGADGVVIGTRLWATNEALGPQKYKQALVDAKSCDDVVRTRVFDAIYNSYRKLLWPEPYDSSGTLRNTLTETWDNEQEYSKLRSLLDEDDSSKKNDLISNFKQANKEEDAAIAQVYSGQGVGEIHSIEPAHDVIEQINKDTISILQGLQKNVLLD